MLFRYNGRSFSSPSGALFSTCVMVPLCVDGNWILKCMPKLVGFICNTWRADKHATTDLSLTYTLILVFDKHDGALRHIRLST